MRIYNTLTRTLEEFVTLVPDEVRMYVCGVTVYDVCHIGHARSAIVFDVVQRYLRARGYRVTFIKNFTDVDDKIINRAQAEGATAREVSERYIAEYRVDMASIGVEPADVEPKATDHIPAMVTLIERLLAHGVAYVVDGDVYFEVRRFPPYGQLSGKNLDDLVAGARVDVDERKRDPRDFALWKASKPGEPAWDSPWGPGRPGWHIECSAMAMAYLGESFDLHGGGEDLIFPHHECEIAQSEAATGKPFVRVWVHNGFVNLGAEKMSKSLGNILTIRELVKRHPPDALRLWLLNTHYRHPVEFSEERLVENARALQRLTNALKLPARRAQEAGIPFGRSDDPATLTSVEADLSRLADDALRGAVGTRVAEFTSAMDEDFNTPQARAALFGLAAVLTEQAQRLDEREAVQAGRTPRERAVEDLVHATRVLWQLARMLGLLRDVTLEDAERAKAPDDVERLVIERTEARRRRDWARADALRMEIHERGWSVEDTPAGPRVTRRNG